MPYHAHHYRNAFYNNLAQPIASHNDIMLVLITKGLEEEIDVDKLALTNTSGKLLGMC
jgi:hypothetical protein